MSASRATQQTFNPTLQFFAGLYQDVFGNGVRSGKLEAASVPCPIVVTARAQVSSHMAVSMPFPERVHL
jgi:hypothetical protein